MDLLYVLLVAFVMGFSGSRAGNEQPLKWDETFAQKSIEIFGEKENGFNVSDELASGRNLYEGEMRAEEANLKCYVNENDVLSNIVVFDSNANITWECTELFMELRGFRVDGTSPARDVSFYIQPQPGLLEFHLVHETVSGKIVTSSIVPQNYKTPTIVQLKHEKEFREFLEAIMTIAIREALIRANNKCGPPYELHNGPDDETEKAVGNSGPWSWLSSLKPSFLK